MATQSRRILVLCAGAIALAGLTGCVTDPRLTDGGGGNIISALDKVANGQLSGLTQDELQQLSDMVNQAILATDPNAVVNELTNEQADALLEFLMANNLNSPEDFEMLDPNMVVIPPSLIEAFTGDDSPFMDPDAPTQEEIDALLNMVFMQ